MTILEFNNWVIDNGFDAPGYIEKPAGENEAHSHDRTAAVLVDRGQFGLEVNGEYREYSAGDHFTLEANIVHREIFGPSGVGYYFAWKTN